MLDQSQSSFQSQQDYMYCPYDGYQFIDSETNCQECNFSRNKKYPWRKILFEKQEYPDNYTDKTFLNSIILDQQHNDYTYFQIVKQSVEIIIQISISVIYFDIYYVLYNDVVKTENALIFFFVLNVVGCFLYIAFHQKILKIIFIRQYMKSMGLLYGCCFLLSPIIFSIFRNYHGNIVLPLIFISQLIQLFLKDYEFETKPLYFLLNIVLKTFKLMYLHSLIYLLHFYYQVDYKFSLKFLYYYQTILCKLFQLSFFEQFRYLKYQINKKSDKLYYYTFLIIQIIVFAANYAISPKFALIYLGLVIFISFLCPLWMIWMFQYKNLIYGPWDIPHVKQHQLQ